MDGSTKLQISVQWDCNFRIQVGKLVGKWKENIEKESDLVKLKPQLKYQYHGNNAFYKVNNKVIIIGAEGNYMVLFLEELNDKVMIASINY